MTDIQNFAEVIKSFKINCDKTEYGFVSVQNTQFKFEDGMLGTFQEDRGVTIIATKEYLDKNDLQYHILFAKLEIEIDPNLQVMGFTSFLANKLTENNVAVNIVSGYFHDYLFVQYDIYQKVVEILNNLQQN